MSKWIFAAVLIAALFVLVGCWGSSPATPTPTPTLSNPQVIATAVRATVVAQARSEATAERVASLSGSAESSATLEPTATVKPSATPRPSATPEPSATAKPAEKPANIQPSTIAGGVMLFDGTRSYDQFVAEKGGGVPNPNANLCPDEAQVHRDLALANGVKVVKTGDSWSVPTDPCKFTLQAVGIGYASVRMAGNYQFTVAMHPTQEIVVFYGDDLVRDIQGATIRFLPAYPLNHWVLDPAALIAQEFNFGFAQQRNPRYITRAGNFNPTGWNNYDGSYCPETPVQLAAAVGGWPANWTLRDWSGGADMFAVSRDQNNQPLAFYVLTDSAITGANTWIDYYNTQEGRAAQFANGETFPLADATWHCHDGSDGYVPESSTPSNAQTVPANAQVAAQQPVQQQSQAPTTSQCYATAADVAAAVGGQASNWTAPDWDGGAWVFHSDTPVTLRIPSLGGKIDHHSLGSITSGQTSNAIQDASFTCTR